MAEIATFMCSNVQCRMTMRLAHDFPVWDATREFVTRHRSETFCITCKKVVEYTNENACTVCDSDVEIENYNRACPRCKTGTFTMPHLSIMK